MSELHGPLLAREHDWASAFSNDRTILEQLIAPEFRLSFVRDPRASRTVSREEWFTMLDRMTFGGYEIHSSEESIFGDVGVIHLTIRFDEWRLDGNLLPAEYRITDVFVRRTSEWQVISRISQPIAEAPEF